MSDKICFHSESEILHLNSQGQVDSAQGARRRQAALRDGAQQAGTDFNTDLLNALVLVVTIAPALRDLINVHLTYGRDPEFAWF